jgi:MoaA/NifB/PqqE/SkfB family radical SAM enzyme
VSRRCNFKCGFCIENDGLLASKKETDPSILFERVLSQYKEQGIYPHVSITGGEPTLFPDRLRNILNACSNQSISRVSINTNGENVEAISDLDNYFINLSRHHYEPDKVMDVFGKKFKDTIVKEKTVMQCVLMKDYIDSVEKMKKYMDYYADKGAIGYSFRGLTKLDATKQYSKEIDFSKAHAINFYDIVNNIAKDPDFKFIQQKIGDHYWFEIWEYKGKKFRLTYSNFEFLREVEVKERSSGLWFSRATIILPYGEVYSGWSYDINLIHKE